MIDRLPIAGPAGDTDPMERFDPDSRRIDSVEGVPVTLADGRVWHLACATDRYRTVFEGDVFVGVEPYRGFPPGVDRPVNQLVKASREKPDAVPVSLIFGAAVALLRRAHNLSAAEAAALLNVGADQLPGICLALVAAIDGPPAGEGADG